MSDIDTSELRSLLAKATPGPWEVGDWWHVQGERHCRCDAGPLVWSGTRDINGTRMAAHVHRRTEPIGADIMQADASNGYPANVSFGSDYGPGVEEADAALIAAAVNALPALLDAADERDHLRTALLTEPAITAAANAISPDATHPEDIAVAREAAVEAITAALGAIA